MFHVSVRRKNLKQWGLSKLPTISLDAISFIVTVMYDCPSGYPSLIGIVLVAGPFEIYHISNSYFEISRKSHNSIFAVVIESN